MKIAKNIYFTVSILFLLWVFASYLDIIADNITPDPQHSIYNFFVIIEKFWRI